MTYIYVKIGGLPIEEQPVLYGSSSMQLEPCQIGVAFCCTNILQCPDRVLENAFSMYVCLLRCISMMGVFYIAWVGFTYMVMAVLHSTMIIGISSSRECYTVIRTYRLYARLLCCSPLQIGSNSYHVEVCF